MFISVWYLLIMPLSTDCKFYIKKLIKCYWNGFKRYEFQVEEL